MQLWELLALLSLVALLSQALGVLRRGVRGHRGYLALLVGDLLLLAWLAHGDRLTRTQGGPTMELLGALIACAVLVVVPAVLDGLVRRALAREDFRRAARLAGIKEVLVPGSASALEHEFYRQAAAARAGRVDEVVGALRRQLLTAEPPFDEGIQERIVTVLLLAGRWRDATTQYEAHLGGDPAHHPALAALAGQMVRAYGALGELDTAARLLEGLEERLNPDDPSSWLVLQQARLHLLAHAGALPEVERVLDHPALAWMKPPARLALLEIARDRARSLGAGKDGEVAPLLPLDRPLALFLETVAERATADRERLARLPRLPPATVSLIALNLVAFSLFALLLGGTDSAPHLLRGGANFHAAVRAGEWWRLWTALFLHGGVVHLLFNLYALFLLGRLVEPLFGAPRLLAIYGVAGLAGNLASAANPDPHAVFSLGASGAVLGLMAALMVTLVLRRMRRGSLPDVWRREVLSNLGLLVLIQIAVGFLIPAVDNLAHLGGLAAGAAMALFVAPGGPLGRGRVAQLLLAALLSLLGASAVRSAMSLVRADPAATLARLPRQLVRGGHMALSVLAGTRPGEAKSPGELIVEVVPAGIELRAMLVTTGASSEEVLGQQVEADHAGTTGTARGLRPVEGAWGPDVNGWPSRAAQADPQGDLLLYYARPGPPGSVVIARVLQPGQARLSRPAAGEIARLLASLRVDPEAGSEPLPGAPPAPPPVRSP